MKKEKEIKTTRLEMRLTPTEKEQLRAYAEKHEMTMSEAVMYLCREIFESK